MQRTSKGRVRFLALSLVVFPALVTAARVASAQDAAPPAAAFPGADAPPAASPAPSAAPVEQVPSPAPSDTAVAPAPPLEPAPPMPVVPPAPPVAPSPSTSTGSAAFAPLPEPTRTRVATPKPRRPAPVAAPVVATPPLAGEPPAGAPPSPEPSEEKDDSNGVFGPFRIGFLIGGGLPDLVSLGGIIKVTKYVGFGVNVGIIPTVKLSLYGDATLSYQEYDAYGRIFPFGGAFFLGSGLGYGTIKGTVKNSYALTPEEVAVSGLSSPFEIDSAGSVRTMVLTPQIGFLKTFASGFTIGADAGAQIPVAPSKVDYATHVPSGVPAQLVTPNDAKVRSTLDTIGRTTLPTFNIKVGWLL